MTIISLMTNDQHLLTMQKPMVASGDYNSVKLQVEFDAAWNNYIVRSATFYTSNDETIFESLLIDDACVVPNEVLQKSGTLFIGLRGYSETGEKIKTTSLVKYKITQGADTSSPTTLEPSKDMYRQFIEAINGQYDPLSAQLIAQYEEFKEEIEEEYGAKIKDLDESKVEMSIGTYKGNGAYAVGGGNQKYSQDIIIGKTPVVVIVLNTYTGTVDIAIAGHSGLAFEIIENGFRVAESYNYSANDNSGQNMDGKIYSYIAFFQGGDINVA